MELATFEQLLTPRGESALAAARELEPTDKTFLAAYEKLRKRFPPELAKAAVETIILRAKAAAKFPDAGRMFFTREALEQASSWPVASYRSKRFREFVTVGDFCCGIGADATALAADGRTVVAIEHDPLRARVAEANLSCSLSPWGGGLGRGVSASPAGEDRVRGREVTPLPNPPPQGGREQESGLAKPRPDLRNHVLLADVLTDPLPRVDAFFCDPGRRADGRRFLSVADYQPPPAAVLARFPPGFPAAFKLAPGVPWDDLHAFDGEAEFISLDGELKECVLWLGPLKTCRVRATALPSGETLAAVEPAAPPPTSEPLHYVYDPDPSLTRSGLLTNFAATIDGRLLDERIGFLTSNDLKPTPFATIYEVEETLPFHAKKLGEWFRTHDIGRVTVVKRGSPADADELLRKWKLAGTRHREVLLTQAAGRPVAIIATRAV